MPSQAVQHPVDSSEVEFHLLSNISILDVTGIDTGVS